VQLQFPLVNEDSHREKLLRCCKYHGAHSFPPPGKCGKQKYKYNGISLVEIMIGLTVLSFIFGPLWQLFSRGRTIVRIGKHDLDVLNLGTSFANQAKRLKPEMLPETGGEIDLPNPGSDGKVSLGGGGTVNIIILQAWDKEIFKLRYSVRKFALPPPIQGSGGESKLDDLSIAWQEKLGQPKTRQFAALLVRR